MNSHQRQEFKRCLESLIEPHYEDFIDDVGHGADLRRLDEALLDGELYRQEKAYCDSIIETKESLNRWFERGR